MICSPSLRSIAGGNSSPAASPSDGQIERLGARDRRVQREGNERDNEETEDLQERFTIAGRELPATLQRARRDAMALGFV